MRIDLDVFARRDLPATAKLVHAYLRECSPRQGSSVENLTAEEIADACGVGVRSVYRAVTQLRNAGVIVANLPRRILVYQLLEE